ncbi:hypothetical protein [Derxia lacustris]|uniref:hypothetical protein n=1 Tax=Derxia lacustris TaxID=764842 RepID=UPI000A17207E|nr:hypothetical protein [Derxia lacustris]
MSQTASKPRKPPVVPATPEDIRQDKPPQSPTEDRIDENGEESFPASDPPAQRDPDHDRD